MLNKIGDNDIFVLITFSKEGIEDFKMKHGVYQILPVYISTWCVF